MKKKLIGSFIAGIAFLSLIFLTGVVKANWAMFQRDAQHTGRSSVLGPQTNDLKWTFPENGDNSKEIYHTPVISSNGTIYLAIERYIKGDSRKKYGICALDSDGTEKWFYEAPVFSSLILGKDGGIWAFTTHKLLYLSPEGSLKWEKEITYIPDNSKISPVVDGDGMLYFGAEPFSQEKSSSLWIMKISPEGEINYLYEVAQKGSYLPYTVMFPIVDSDGIIYFNLGNVLYALNSDGTEKWKKELTIERNSESFSIAVFPFSISDRGIIYVPVSYNGRNPRIEESQLFAIDAETSDVLWDGNFSGRITGPPAISSDETIYFFNSSSSNYAWWHKYLNSVNILSDKYKLVESWSQQYGGCDSHSLPIVDAEGNIYFTFGKKVLAFDSGGDKIWEFNRSDDWAEALALGQDRTLYVSGREKFYAFNSQIEDEFPESKTIYVDDDFIDDPVNHKWNAIQEGVDDANEGDTIIVKNGIYIENVEVNKTHLTIRSESGAEGTIVQAAEPDVNPHAIYAFKVSADHVTINGFTIKGFIGEGSGIYLRIANYCNIFDNIISNSQGGIYLLNSSNNILTGNIILNNFVGVRLCSSSNNALTNNITSNNNDGIMLYSSSDNNILVNNIANSNHRQGIYLQFSDENTLTDNDTSNNDYGIRLDSSSNNILTGNTINSNRQYGIYLSFSNDNIIYLNNFIDNTYNFYSYKSTNIWNSILSITYIYNNSSYANYLGNHWDNYTNVDTDSNGIWDNPYIMNSDQDNYPLVMPFENYADDNSSQDQLPILLVHGFQYPLSLEDITAYGMGWWSFDPVDAWKEMAETLTGIEKERQVWNRVWYDNNTHYLWKLTEECDTDLCIENQSDPTIYISNYTNNTDISSCSSIHQYAFNLANEIGTIKENEGVNVIKEGKLNKEIKLETDLTGNPNILYMG